jgi:hypothetical protein
VTNNGCQVVDSGARALQFNVGPANRGWIEYPAADTVRSIDKAGSLFAWIKTDMPDFVGGVVNRGGVSEAVDDFVVGARVDEDRRNGRGAESNRSGRFEPIERTHFDDGWGTIDFLPPLRTEVQEEKPRKIITTNDSPDISFDRSINPYRGCEHGCIYCYARPSHAYVDLSPGLDFETRLFYKADAARLLRDEIRGKVEVELRQLDVSYVGNRTLAYSGNMNLNLPGWSFAKQCDMTSGGKRSICDAQVSNPFVGIAPLKGTSLYTSSTISAFIGAAFAFQGRQVRGAGPWKATTRHRFGVRSSPPPMRYPS